jgi:outer membrane protein OmpA-like peptidoglycan-associated protein
MAAPSTPDGLDELRDLLVSPERRAIDELRARLDDPVARARDLANGLPDALARANDDHRLSEALQPSVEDAITSSVRRNPRPLADALFPVMGPAIRKAITHTLSGMLESMGRTLEHSVSLRAIQWRIVAWRTGKPFAEIVLLNTLVFRVEQVFLIHASTGLLLQHVVAETVDAQDADMVSGMLTAIRDFARDSFGGRVDDTLDTFRVGELNGIIEHGPHAYIAAVVRGARPPDLRHTLQHALETIHLQLAPELERFDGDAARFEDARPVLQECLESQYRDADTKTSHRGWWAALGLAVLLLGVWGAFRWVDHVRFTRYLAALHAQPGLVVVGTSRQGGRYVVRGLRDPLAPDPGTFIAASGMGPDDVVGDWQLFQAMDPRLAVPRASAILRPPRGVTLTMRGDTLAAAGEAPTSWIHDAELLARTVPGVRQFDPSHLENAELRETSRQLEALMVQFVRGTAEIVPGQQIAIETMVQELRQLDKRARDAGVDFRVIITGHTDADGPEDRNLVLSRERAAAIVAAIPAGDLPSLEFDARGVGSAEPIAMGATEEDKQRNRRVAVRVEPLASSTQP